MAKTDHHLSDLERAQIQAHLELGFKVLLLGAECASNLKVCGIRTHLKSTTAWSTSPCALLRGIRHSLRKRLRKNALFTHAVQRDRAAGQFNAALQRDGLQAVLNHRVVKLLHQTGFGADEVAVVLFTVVEFIDRLVLTEQCFFEHAGLLKLRQYAVNRRQAEVNVVEQQQAVNLFGGQMPLRAGLENAQNLRSRQGDLQAALH